jgi:hypothetical protein
MRRPKLALSVLIAVVAVGHFRRFQVIVNEQLMPVKQ